MKRVITQLAATVLTAACISSTAMAAQDSPGSMDELWAIVQQQQARIEQLEQQYQAAAALIAANEEKVAANEQKAASNEQRVTENSERVAANTQRVIATGDYAESLANTRPAGSDWTEKTQIGGYGELHYNNYTLGSGEDKKKVDFHRFVTYFNHQFNDRLRFFSELELEHSIAGEGKAGEIELEQAYIQYDLNDQHILNGGLFLIPVGITNETHEPNTFYGVERNSVEKIIIPTTWWEAGASVGGRYASGLSWDLALTSGLEMSADQYVLDDNGDQILDKDDKPIINKDGFVVRGGRQKVSKATANDLAYTGRLKYTGIPGLELAASYQYQADASQESGDGLDEGQLFSTHAIFQKGWFGLRALYAGWKFDGYAVEAAGADRQKGWYIEPAVKFKPGNYNIGFYARYEDVDAYHVQDQFDEWQVGINYWPVNNVVLKFDYRDRSNDSDKDYDFDGFDLGLGYTF